MLTYADMMQRVARITTTAPLPMLTVPLLTPRLSSHWLALVTDVDTATARNLVDSMSNEVVVSDDSIRERRPRRSRWATTTRYEQALRAAGPGHRCEMTDRRDETATRAASTADRPGGRAWSGRS